MLMWLGCSLLGGPLLQRYFYDCCLSSFDIKDLCGELRFSVSQYSSLSRFFSRYTAYQIIVVYSDVAGVVPKGNQRKIKASLSTIAMKFDAVVAFAWIQR